MTEKAQTYFFFGLLAVAAVLTFFVVSPYLPAIIFAAALAVMFQPVFLRFQKIFHGRTRPAAWLTLFAALLIVFIPLAFIGYQAVREGELAYAHIANGGLQDLPISQSLKDAVQKVVPSFAADYQAMAQKLLDWMLGSAGFLFAHVITVLLNVFICFIALYYFLADGAAIHAWIIRFSPLPEKYDSLILDQLNRTVTSVIRGTLVIATLQGILAGIAFTIFGVPNPVLWGSAAAISALIPGIGTSLVLIPATIYLLLFRSLWQGLGLLIVALFAVGLVDNILSPQLIKRGARIHPFVIFISVIGGLSLFGPLGFIVGPLVMSLLIGLLDIYASLGRLEDKKTAD